jgi:hypothetical protein
MMFLSREGAPQRAFPKCTYVEESPTMSCGREGATPSSPSAFFPPKHVRRLVHSSDPFAQKTIRHCSCSPVSALMLLNLHVDSTCGAHGAISIWPLHQSSLSFRKLRPSIQGSPPLSCRHRTLSPDHGTLQQTRSILPLQTSSRASARSISRDALSTSGRPLSTSNRPSISKHGTTSLSRMILEQSE